MAKLSVFVKTPNQQGFTLLELLITVTIAGVMAAIALPNMSVFLQNNSRSSRMNELTAAFNYARSEAVTRQSNTTVCASTTTPTPANYTCSGANTFANGWIVITDSNTNATVDGTDIVLRITEPDMAGSATLNGRDSLAAAVSAVSFNSGGQTTGAVAALTGVRFTYCDARVLAPGAPVEGADTMRAIIMTRTGHTKTSREGGDADDTHEVRGVNITSCL